MKNRQLLSALSGIDRSKLDAMEDGDEERAKPRALQQMAHAVDNLTSNAPQDLDPSLIADSAIADRLDINEGLDDLIESIRNSGQTLPILVRYVKHSDGPIYEVVYGRRRLAAARALGIKVKAFIRRMDDEEALIAQAIENSARRDRSYIETALFALRLNSTGMSNAKIAEGLAVNDSALSRLLGVARALPVELINAIGPAPSHGRRPWLALKDLVDRLSPENLAGLISAVRSDIPSDERLTDLVTQAEALVQRQFALNQSRIVHSPTVSTAQMAVGADAALSQVQAKAPALSVTGDEITSVTPAVQHQSPTGDTANPSSVSRPEAVAAGKELIAQINSIQITLGRKKLTLHTSEPLERAFLEDLMTNMETLYAEWVKRTRQT